MYQNHVIGGLACKDWLKLGTTEQIIYLRDELRMGKNGFAFGDRTFKRCYLRAAAEVARFKRLSPTDQAAVELTRFEGMEYKKGWMDKTDKLPRRRQLIRLSNGKVPQEMQDDYKPRLRAPYFAIIKSFWNILGKNWHRYLFPFGCYYLDRSQGMGMSDSEPWKEWALEMLHTPQQTTRLINPQSVASADIVSLFFISGYVERISVICTIICWAKLHEVNLLLHRVNSRPGEDTTGHTALEQFISLEKHLFLFGMLHNHGLALLEHEASAGGRWETQREIIEELEKQLYPVFNIDSSNLKSEFERFLIRDLTNMNDLPSLFKRCIKVGEINRDKRT